jgi:hypothetical protein
VTEAEIGQKEKITILLAEYSSLRAEINARVSSSYYVMGIAAALIVFVLQQPIGCNFYIGLLMVVFGGVVSGRLLWYDARNAARRAKEIESDVNTRAGETLLLWETKRSGLTPDYWRAIFFMGKRNSN